MDNELSFTDKQRTLIMLPLLFGGFIALLNEALLNVAFPQLMSTLNVSISTVQFEIQQLLLNQSTENFKVDYIET